MTKYFYRSLYLPGKGMFCELPADLALGRIQVRKIPYVKSPGNMLHYYSTHSLTRYMATSRWGIMCAGLPIILLPL